MVATTNTSHNVAHVPPHNNNVLGNNSVNEGGKSSTGAHDHEAKEPENSQGLFVGLQGRLAETETVKRRGRENVRKKQRK